MSPLMNWAESGAGRSRDMFLGERGSVPTGGTLQGTLAPSCCWNKITYSGIDWTAQVAVLPFLRVFFIQCRLLTICIIYHTHVHISHWYPSGQAGMVSCKSIQKSFIVFVSLTNPVPWDSFGNVRNRWAAMPLSVLAMLLSVLEMSETGGRRCPPSPCM